MFSVYPLFALNFLVISTVLSNFLFTQVNQMVLQRISLLTGFNLFESVLYMVLFTNLTLC